MLRDSAKTCAVMSKAVGHREVYCAMRCTARRNAGPLCLTHPKKGAVHIHNPFHEPGCDYEERVITCTANFHTASVARARCVQYIWNLSTRSMVVMWMLGSHNLRRYAFPRSLRAVCLGARSDDSRITPENTATARHPRTRVHAIKALFRRRDVAANPQTRSTIEERTW
jgi:hypothetical protein